MREDHLRRLELADFLKKRRAQLSPEKVGLSRGRRRRVPGLRREEVAERAGMSATWYTWLEQAREVTCSPAALDRLGIALMLESSELGYLFTLAGHSVPAREVGVGTCAPALQRLLDQVEPFPALVMRLSWDIVAWNGAADAVFGPLGSRVDGERNLLWLAYAEPTYKALFRDWERFAKCTLAHYRADSHLRPESGERPQMVERLKRVSPDFERWWPHHQVKKPDSNWRKELSHPILGELSLDPCEMRLADHSGMLLTVFTPADADTESRLRLR